MNATRTTTDVQIVALRHESRRLQLNGETPDIPQIAATFADCLARWQDRTIRGDDRVLIVAEIRYRVVAHLVAHRQIPPHFLRLVPRTIEADIQYVQLAISNLLAPGRKYF